MDEPKESGEAEEGWHADAAQESDTSALLSNVEDVERVLRARGGGGGGSGAAAGEGSSPLAWLERLSVASLQPYFDVDDQAVKARILHAALPFWRPQPFFEAMGSPDAWAPLWIAVTLVFLLAVGAERVGWRRFDEDEKDEYVYDFNLCVESFGMVFAYVGFSGVAFWGASTYRGFHLGLPHSLCLHGYSLIGYLPTAALLILLPLPLLPWLAMAAAAVFGGRFLANNLAPIVEGREPALVKPVVGVACALQGCFALAVVMTVF